MEIDIVTPVLGFLARYGLIAVFVLLVLDGAMLMPALPGEIVMIMAVAQYATDLASLVMLIAIATVAAIVGSLLLYGVSYKGGRKLIDKYPKLFMMNPRRRERLEKVFSNPAGQSLVFFLRVIPLTRVLVNIPAGLAKMKVGRFLILSSIGLLTYHAVFMYATWKYGNVGGGVSGQAAALTAAYGSPAWDYVRANQVVTILAILAVGAILSIRASRAMFRDPEWAGPSVIGWLAERIVLLGSIVVLVTLWIDETLVWYVANLGGVDLVAMAERRNWDPVSFVGILAAVAGGLAVLLMALSASARRKRRVTLEGPPPPPEEAEVYLKFTQAPTKEATPPAAGSRPGERAPGAGGPRR